MNKHETDKWHADRAEHGVEAADWTLSLDRLARLLRLGVSEEEKRFAVQGWSTNSGEWKEKFNFDDLHSAIESGRRLNCTLAQWSGDLRAVRVIDRTGTILPISIPEGMPTPGEHQNDSSAILERARGTCQAMQSGHIPLKMAWKEWSAQ